MTEELAPQMPDFFVCDVLDAAPKGDWTSMEHPVFTLAKRPDMNLRRYENGKSWLEVRPSTKGLATVFDRDILIYCISQLMHAINAGRPISQRLHLRVHELLLATGRSIGGTNYKQLQDAFDRLTGTQIATNLATGGQESYEVFALVFAAKVVRETREGRMQEMEIVLSDWIFRAIKEQEVLTLNRRYFELTKSLERRLYELARKHCGSQPRWPISLDKLREKCGSQASPREFKRMVQEIVDDDALRDHMPEYGFVIERRNVIVQRKPEKDWLEPPKLLVPLEPDTLEAAKELAPGWDIQGLKVEWQDWLQRIKLVPADPDRHFLSFCRKRGRYPGFR